MPIVHASASSSPMISPVHQQQPNRNGTGAPVHAKQPTHGLGVCKLSGRGVEWLDWVGLARARRRKLSSSFVGPSRHSLYALHPTHPLVFARYCSHREAMLRRGGHPEGVTHVTGRLGPR